MRVRSIRPEDRQEWLRLLGGLYPKHPESEHTPSVDAYFAGNHHDELIPTEAFVCEQTDGSLVGFLELSVRNYAEGCVGRTPYVESWYVDPEFRQQGVGRLLMDAAKGWARQHGYSELASDTELDNLRSQQAHRSLGFQEVERAVHFRTVL